MKGIQNTIHKAHCWKCGETNPRKFQFKGKNHHPDFLRAMCKPCEITSRFYHVRGKKKELKNIVTTHGGSSSSPQKTKKRAA